MYGEVELTEVFTASTIYNKWFCHQSELLERWIRSTSISTSSPECNHWSRAQQNSFLNVCGCRCEPWDGNVGRLRDGDCGGELRARAAVGSGEGGSETATLEEEDVSEWLRSGSVSKGFSSSKPISIADAGGVTDSFGSNESNERRTEPSKKVQRRIGL